MLAHLDRYFKNCAVNIFKELVKWSHNEPKEVLKFK